MSVESLRARLPETFKDVRLNLSALVNEEVLDEQTKWGLLLACAIASRNVEARAAFFAEAAKRLTPAAIEAARAAAATMAMNNVYYRATHLIANQEYAKAPARLRMSVIANPGVAKADFELWCLAVSAINGCGACLDAHEKAVREAGASAETVQAALRYAAIVQSAAVALEAAGESATAA